MPGKIHFHNYNSSLSAESPPSFFFISAMASVPTSRLAQPPLDTQHPADKVQESHSQRDIVMNSVKRLSNVVEKTVDKLSRSVSGASPPTSTPTSPSTIRVFSLSRKNRTERDAAGMLNSPIVLNIFDISVVISSTSEPKPIISKSQSNNVTSSHTEDSPFIRPPSPIQPSLRQSIRGDGSV